MGVARVLLVTAVLLNAVSVISAAEAKSVNVALRAKWKVGLTSVFRPNPTLGWGRRSGEPFEETCHVLALGIMK